MRFNPFKTTPREPVLLAITPPRNAERTVLGLENLLGSIAVPEPFSLELCGDADGVTLLARCLDQEVVRQQLSAHYPQARIQELESAEDPLSLAEGEQAWQMRLRASGPEYVPLRVFRDDDLLDPGSDPLIALLGALSALRPGERVVSRLLLRSLGPDWSRQHQAKAHERPVPERTDSYQISESRRHRLDIAGLAVLAVAAFPAIKGYQWWQAGEEWKTIALGASIALALGAAGWAWARWQRSRNRVFDPRVIDEKVSRIAFEAELQVTAILPGDDQRERARELLGQVAAAYRHYDHPAGARFQVGKVRPGLPDPAVLAPPAPGLLGSRSVLGVREAACLWHPPGAKDETPLVARSGRACYSPRRAASPAGRLSAGPPRAARRTSASPTASRGATTSMWRARAWASRRSCSTSSPTASPKRRRDATATRSS